MTVLDSWQHRGTRPWASRSNLPKSCAFGVFEVDLRARELHKQGKRIKLQDQPFQVLAVLLQRSGEVVSREELRQQIWPEDTFVDFDNSLNTAINKLREALFWLWFAKTPAGSEINDLAAVASTG